MSKKRKHVDFQQTANGGVAGKEESPQVERKMKVILDEISVTGSNIYGSGTFTTYNPDDLVGKKGLEIYKKMRIDDQIKAVLTMKKMAMLSTGWDVHSASQEIEDIEKRDFIKWNLDNLVGTLEDHLYNIFTGYDFGFCLHGDTIIHSPEGDRPIKDFVGRQPWVYSWKDGQLKLAKASKVWMTKKDVPCIKVTYEWWAHGERKEAFIICTENHPFLMRDGSYMQAGKLKANDRLAYFSQRIGTPGSGKYKRPRAFIKTNGFEYGKSAWIRKSHWIWEQKNGKLSEGHVIHHLDNDTLNDSPDNLIAIPEKIHVSNHSKQWWQNATPEQLKERNKHSSDTANLPENIKNRSEKTTQGNLRTWKDPIVRQRRIDGIIRAKSNLSLESIQNIRIAAQNPDRRRSISEAKKLWWAKHKAAEDNHRVISVESCGIADVYDMEVPEYHNFAANHVFVHNSLSELVYYRIEKGQWAGRIGLKAIKTREPFNYLFDADEHGNLADDGIVYIGALPSWTVIEDWQKDLKKSGVGQRYPVNKFIIFSYSKEFSNFYGQSDLRAAYRSYFSKEILIRFMNIYGERFGMPTHVGKVPPGTPKPDRDDLKKVLDQVQSKYAIVIPNDIAIDLLQAGSGGWEGYRSAIEMHNKFIARSILVPDLMGYTEMTGGGAFALGKKQFDMFLWIINRGQRDVEESIMGEQVIKRLVDLNWADTENYPKFKFGSITEEGSVAKSQILAMALTSGLVNREEEWVRDYLGLPARDPNMELPPMQVPGAGVELPPAIEERLKGLEGKVDEVKGFFTEFKRKLILDFQEKKELKTVKVKPTKFDKKLNYVELKKTLDDYEEESVDSMSAVVKRMRDDMVRFVRRRKIIEDKDAAAINKLQVKYVGDLKRDLESRLVKLYLDSKLNAAKMLQESGVKLEIVTKFQEVSIPEWEPVPPVDAIDFFRKKVLVKVIKGDGTKVLVELATGKILEYYTQKAFYVAGVERDYILKEAKASLLASLRDGDSVDAAIFNLSNVFDKYIERGELDDEGELVTPHRLETIVRTNFSEAYNQGLRDFIDDNEITNFVPAMQWSAILDSRVRLSHSLAHGMIFREDDPVLEKIGPPAGYNALLKGERILTNDGYIPIERIEVGNEVSTHKNRWRKVIETMSKFWDKGYYLLELENGDKLKITEDHPVLTRNKGWVLMKDLELSDDVIVTYEIKTLDKSV